MQVSKQSCHLLIVEASGKSRHHSPAGEHILPHRRIGGRYTAGQRFAVKNSMQVRRDFLQRQVILFMTMRAAHLVEMLPFRLLWRKLRRGVAASQTHCDKKTNGNIKPSRYTNAWQSIPEAPVVCP